LPEPTRERLENWKEIAHHLRRSVRTVQRWESEEGLPVHRLNHDQRSSVYAYKDELDTWRVTRAPLQKAPEPVKRWTPLRIVMAAIAAGAILAAIWILRKPGAPVAVLQIKPLISLPGYEYAPALSPDGRTVLFTYAHEGSAFLYRLSMAGGEPMRVTQAAQPRSEFDAAWSPDGAWIAFLRRVSLGEAMVVVLPAAGGAERELGLVQGVSMSANVQVPNRGLGWAADSRAVIVSSGEAAGMPNRLWRVDLATGKRLALTHPPAGVFGDAAPAVSPDGRRIAFHRGFAAGVTEIFVSDLNRQGELTGELVQITRRGVLSASPLWISAQELVYYGYRNGMMQLCRRRIGDGSEEVTFAGTEGVHPTYSPATRQLVYETTHNNDDLFRSDGVPAGSPSPYLSSTRQEAGPAISPDGRLVAFTSGRAGWPEIWVCRADQTHCRQVSHLNGSFTGFASWSPNNRELAFSSNGSGLGNIYVVQADGTGLRELAAHPAEDIAPCWSADGRAIYFSSKRSGHYQILRVPADGGSPQVIADHGFEPVATRDGRWLFYISDFKQGLRLLRLDLRTRQEFDDLGRTRQFGFAAGQRGIYFVGVDPGSAIFYWQPGIPQPVVKFRTHRPVRLGLAVAPDETYVIYTGGQPTIHDLMVIDGVP
jgi:Tol biopolymer transport system component